jgi:hypothetical protein
MKTIVSILGTVLLIGAVALAQSSSGSATKTSKKTSTDSSSQLANTASSNSDTSASPSSTSVKAGNSGFDDDSTTATAQTSGSSAPTTSGQTNSGSPSSAQSGSSQAGDTDSIVNGPVAETVSDSSAVIGWSTRSAANGTGIKYGANRASMSQTVQGTDGSDGKNHHAKLDGLSPNTRYYFQVTANGQPVGGVGTFKTTASGEQPVQSKAVIPQK